MRSGSRPWRLRLGAAAVAVAASASLAGCWSSIPLGHRALVQILAVDPAKGGDTRWTFFQANPTALAQMGSGGSSAGPGGGTTSQQVIAVAVVAPDLATAFRQAQALTSRDLYLGQLEEVVLSEKLSPPQLASTLDALAHTPELDQSQILFAAPDSAANTVLAPDPQELFPATYLERVVSCPTCNVTALPTTLMDAFVRTRTAWGAMVLPEAIVAPTGLATRGAAVYEGTRLVDRLDQGQEELLGLLMGKVTKGAMGLDVPGMGHVAVRSLVAKARVSAAWRDGRLTARVDLRLAGAILSAAPASGRTLVHLAPTVESALSARVVQEAGGLLGRLMGRGADPLFLGQRLWAADPSAAPPATTWATAVRFATVALSVTTHLHSAGGAR